MIFKYNKFIEHRDDIMKKFTISKKYMVFVIIAYIIILFLIFFFAFRRINLTKLATALFLYSFLVFIYLNNYRKRTIKLSDEFITIDSYYSTLNPSEKGSRIMISYNDILEVKYIRTLQFKKYKLKLKCKNIKGYIFIEPFYDEYESLYKLFYSNLTAVNKQVVIKDFIRNYLESL